MHDTPKHGRVVTARTEPRVDHLDLATDEDIQQPHSTMAKFRQEAIPGHSRLKSKKSELTPDPCQNHIGDIHMAKPDKASCRIQLQSGINAAHNS